MNTEEKITYVNIESVFEVLDNDCRQILDRNRNLKSDYLITVRLPKICLQTSYQAFVESHKIMLDKIHEEIKIFENIGRGISMTNVVFKRIMNPSGIETMGQYEITFSNKI